MKNVLVVSNQTDRKKFTRKHRGKKYLLYGLTDNSQRQFSLN